MRASCFWRIFSFFFFKVALGTGEGVALLLDEVEDDFELAQVVRGEAALALARLVGVEEVELLLPVPHEAGGDAKHAGDFADGVITFGEELW